MVVNKHSSLIVEQKNGRGSHRSLWASSKPFTIGAHPQLRLVREEENYAIYKGNRSEHKIAEFSQAEAFQGVELNLLGRHVGLKITSANGRIERWFESEVSTSSSKASELMLLSGRNTHFLNSELVSRKYKSSQFKVEKRGGKWKIKCNSPSLKVIDNKLEISIQVMNAMNPAEWSRLLITDGSQWWRFRWVETSDLSFRGEWPVRLLASGVVTAAIFLMMSVAGSLVNPSTIPHANQDRIAALPISITQEPIFKTEPKEALVKPEVTAPQMVAAQTASPAPVIEKPKPLPTPSRKQVTASAKSAAKAVDSETAKAHAQASWLRSQMQALVKSSGHSEASASDRRPVLAYPVLPTALNHLTMDDSGKDSASQGSEELKQLRTAASSGMSNGDDSEQSLKIASRAAQVVEERTDYTVVGSLTHSQIEEAVSQQINSLRICYETALSRKTGLGGKMLLNFVIGSSGKVEVAKVAETEIGDPNLQRCVLHEVRGWTFPSPEKGEVSVSYPFLFKALGVDG